jgi:flagellar protein FliS
MPTLTGQHPNSAAPHASPQLAASPPPAASPGADAYLATKVMSASHEELRMMLIDGAIKFCRQGRDALARGDFEGCHAGYSKCRSILLELISSMRPEVDPELCSRLSGLYVFMFRELLESSHERKTDRADKVLALLEYDRESWAMLMEKLAVEKAAAGHTLARAGVGEGGGLPGREGRDYAPLSVSG